MRCLAKDIKRTRVAQRVSVSSEISCCGKGGKTLKLKSADRKKSFLGVEKSLKEEEKNIF